MLKLLIVIFSVIYVKSKESLWFSIKKFSFLNFLQVAQQELYLNGVLVGVSKITELAHLKLFFFKNRRLLYGRYRM
jgi:hypothetical protein